ncbi:MAG: energy transducer TonB [Bacteroidales bacterium]|nr:energy transducer TonB [Bacteroidales bacterium]MBN2633662.1 energy transducer TonB [Bacteroidales bacterium]
MNKIPGHIFILIFASIIILLLPSCRGRSDSPRSLPGTAGAETPPPLPPEPYSVADGDTVWYRVDTAPVFSENPEALGLFLFNNIRYPEAAKKKKTQGRVVVGFVLTSDCMVRDAKIITGLSPECDSEALRVVNALPLFSKPAYNGDRPVNFHFFLPVHFRLN